MNRRHFIRSGAIAGVGLIAAPMINLGHFRLFGQEGPRVSTAAADLVLGTGVIDMLGLLTFDWAKLYGWFSRPSRFLEANYRELESSGVDVFHPAVETSGDDPYAEALRWATGWNRLLGSHGCFLDRVDSPAGLTRAPAQGRQAVIVGFQNSNHFRTPIDVRGFYGLGQRVSQLTYNTRNRLGSGCYVETDRGLTPFGAEIVAAMDDVGMAVDVSHCGERTSLDAIEASRSPVLLTHSNAKALVPGQPRCKSDRVIRAMAARGGVMGITTVRAFVGHGRPSVDDLLDHFDHVARLVGVEHLGLGSDVDITALNPKTGRLNPFYAIRGLSPVTRVFQIADGLLRRGYGPTAVRSVLGGNFRRVLGEIWHREPREDDRDRPWRRDPFCPAPAPSASALDGAVERSG